LYPLPAINTLPALISSEPRLMGLNVTIPYEKEVLRFLDELSPEAEAIGAVNTISIVRNGKSTRLKGWNTDATAFRLELDEFAPANKAKALILGTGGAAAAAVYVLRNRGWACTMVSRKKNPTVQPNIISYDSLSKQLIGETCLIVNASPAGMYPDTEGLPELPWAWINESHLLFDMVYNPPVTRFLANGAIKGAGTRNGLGMLYKQAELAWEIWQAEDYKGK